MLTGPKGVQYYCFVVPMVYIADLVEAADVASVRVSNRARRPCIGCMVPNFKLAEPGPYEPRRETDVLRIIDEAIQWTESKEPGAITAAEGVCKEFSLHPCRVCLLLIVVL